MNDQEADRLVRHLRWLNTLPPGWHALFQRAAERFAAEAPSVEVDQAKQKFGGMRIYVSLADENAIAAAREAEQASRTACEECGAEAKLMVDAGGWYRTLCELHSNGFERPKQREPR